MKSLVCFMLTLFVALGPAGCSERTENDVPSERTTQSATEIENPPTATENTPTVEVTQPQQAEKEATMQKLKLAIGDKALTATLADNSSAKALIELLPLTIEMSDYGGFEKVGDLGAKLPTNDEQITTEAGDLILYQGGAFVIYYAPNSWSFTRLGKIDNVTAKELKEILGNGSVTVTLSPQEE